MIIHLAALLDSCKHGNQFPCTRSVLVKMEYFGPSNSADLATLTHLDEHILLNELRQRYERDRIYVRKAFTYHKCDIESEEYIQQNTYRHTFRYLGRFI